MGIAGLGYRMYVYLKNVGLGTRHTSVENRTYSKSFSARSIDTSIEPSVSLSFPFNLISLHPPVYTHPIILYHPTSPLANTIRQ